MSKYEDPTQLDYRYGGDTVDDFAQKYMKTVAYIFSALNELRSPTGGTLTQNPEAYQLKVDDNKLYIRNQANTDWILLGDVQENFGFRTSAADAFMHESDVADSGKAGKLIRADASGKLNADILGNAAKIADKAIQMGLDLADEDRLVYDKDTDTITNRPLQFKVDGDKIYARKDATTGWVLLGDLKQNLGFRDSTDDAFLTESDVADNGTAGKLIRADVNGKLNADILGNAAKMAGKTFAPEDLQDGQIPVYRTSDGTWHAENKGTVGAGKNLMIMDGDKMLGEYNGDEMKAIDIQKSSLAKALAESTGYGIVSGCEPSISGLTVKVGAGVIHLAGGTRKEFVQTNITLDNADPTNPRIDLVYINADGEVAKVTGTAAASPSVPALPTGGISVAQVGVAAGASTGNMLYVKQVAKRTHNNAYSVDLADYDNLYGNAINDDTDVLQEIINNASERWRTIVYDQNFASLTPHQYKLTNPLVVDQTKVKLDSIYLKNNGAGKFAIKTITKDLNEDEVMIKNVNTWERLIINAISSGNGVFVGTDDDEEGIYSGAAFSMRDCKIMKVRTGIEFGNNAHMCMFDNCIISYAESYAINASFSHGATNAGELISFNKCRFFNNNGTILYSNQASEAITLVFNDCSFDYSQYAVNINGTGDVYRGLRVIFNNCHFETNTTVTPNEYISVSNGCEAIFNNCIFVLGGDWGGRNFVENNRARVKFDKCLFYYGGYTISYRKPRYINDTNCDPISGGSIVTNCYFINSQSLCALGQSQSIIPDGIGGVTLTGDTTKTTYNNGVYTIVGDAKNPNGIVIEKECNPGSVIVPYFDFKMQNVIQGTANWQGFYIYLSYLDKNNNKLYFAPKIQVGNNDDYQQSNGPNGLDFYAYTAPQGTAKVQLQIAMMQCSGSVLLKNLGFWVI